ncbi:ABCB6 [Scenedesmus sp. PABB004]|nr:ABCB6 [Scenedesmus sp. PABB004]
MADTQPEKPSGTVVSVRADYSLSDSSPRKGGGAGDATSAAAPSPATERPAATGYFALYSTADALDRALVAAGVLGGLASGVMLPLFSILFGGFVNAFGEYWPDCAGPPPPLLAASGRLIGNAEFSNLVSSIALQFLYLAIGAAVAGVLQQGAFTLASVRQTNRLRRLYLRAVMRQDISFFDTQATTGGLLQGLNEDALAVQQALSDKARPARAPARARAAHAAPAPRARTARPRDTRRPWRPRAAAARDMTLVLVGCMPFLAGVGGVLAKLTTSLTDKQNAAYTEAGAVVQQSLAQIRTVAAYNGEAAAHAEYDARLDVPQKVGNQVGLLGGLSLGAMQFVMFCSYAVALFYGSVRVTQGAMMGGDVINVMFAALLGSFSLGMAAPQLQHFYKGASSGAKMVPAIDAECDGDEPGAVAGALRLEGVSFAYPARPDVMVMTSLTLDVPAGKTVALVGSSGSGKSTVVGLIEVRAAALPRADRSAAPHTPTTHPTTTATATTTPAALLRPLEGAVLLDGRDIRTLKLSWLRAQVGLVSQEPTLFATTIYDNILQGRPGASEEEVTAAARSANAHNYITALPQGYQTQARCGGAAAAAAAARAGRRAGAAAIPSTHAASVRARGALRAQVGERGVQLSGGQKQRIAIARAILKNPKILLLDEATSALDSESEAIVQDALDRMVVGRTTIVVAHRLSTVQGADAIVVMAGGRVVERGTHAELLADPLGAYTNLVKLQMQQAEAADEVEAEVAEVLASDGCPVSRDSLDRVASRRRSLEVARRTSSGAQPSAHASTHSLEEALAAEQAEVAKRCGTTSAAGAGAGAWAAGRAAASLGGRPGARRAPRRTARSASRDAVQVVVEGAPAPPHGAAPAAAFATEGAAAATAPTARRAGWLARCGGKAAAAKDGKDEAPPAEPAVNVPFSRLFALNRPELGYLLLGTVASAVVGAVQPAFAFIISGMTANFFTPVSAARSRHAPRRGARARSAAAPLAAPRPRSPRALRAAAPQDVWALRRSASLYAWAFFAIACGVLIATALQLWSFAVAGQALSRRVRLLLFGAMLRQNIGWYDLDENASGRLGSALATDAAVLRGAVGDVFGVVSQNVSLMAVAYGLAFWLNWRVALLITGAAPLVVVGGYIHIRLTFGLSSSSDKLYATANQAVQEAVASIRAYNMQPQVSGTYRHLLHAANVANRKTSAIGGASMGYSQFVMFAMYGLITWFGGYELSSCRSSFDSFLKAFFCVIFAALGLAQSQMSFPDLAKAKGALARVFPMIDRVPPIDSASADGDAPDPRGVAGALELRHVVFAYPNRPAVRVFNNFCLSVPAGKTVALVGESGSGKSTVVGLIERFYDPLEGSVLLDGCDIRTYNLKWLRHQIGLVSQEPLLFSGSIIDNIRYGRPTATLAEVEAAARSANAHDFISALPQGYDTPVGERGVQLSGGQKQRVAIARAVVKDPKILLLDEATSALDAASERVVQDALDRVMGGRTSVVVAHRLSTIRGAHAIAVVFRGVILEQGTHDELLAIPHGGYARLVAAQMKGGGGGGAH